MRVPLLLCLAVAMGCHQPKDEQPPDHQVPDEQAFTCKEAQPAPPPPTPSSCREGWCWANPLPQGLSLTAVWASGPDSAWMVGPRGTLVRARGDALELIDTGTQADLLDAWGSSEQDVWAAGKGGTLLHWNGTRWQAVPAATTQDLTSLTGHSASDVWAAGTNGTLLHWNGVAWEQVALQNPANVRDIASAGADTVWATSGPQLLRCTLASCETVSADVRIGNQTFTLKELLSFSPDEVYALSTELLHWKDGAWSSLGTSDTLRLSDISHLVGSGPEDLWVSAYRPLLLNVPAAQELRHFGTTSAGPTAPTELAGTGVNLLPIHGLAAASPGNLYVVTWRAEVFRLENEQWRSLTVTPPFRIAPDFNSPRAIGRTEIVTDVAALSTGEVGVAALGTRPSWSHIRLFSDSIGSTWVATASRKSRYVAGGFFAPTDMLTLDVSRVCADGTQAVVQTSEKSFDGDPSSDFDYAPSIVGLHGSSEGNVWVVSASDVLHWDGASWRTVMALPSAERSKFTGAVWTTSPDAAWIGLTDGLLAWDGQRLERVELPGFRVNGLWASSSHDVWAVGARSSQPVAFHFDGSGWSEVTLPAEVQGTPSLVDVVGRNESDVYVAGGDGLVLHWDGARWTQVTMPLGIRISRAAKVGSELWLVGGSNELARRAW